MPKVHQPLTKFIDPRSNVYVETGTLIGQSLDEAFWLCPHFEKYISIELSDYYYNLAREKYRRNPKIEIVKGDSGIMLELVLDKISCQAPDSKVCAVLDSHWSGSDTAKGSVSSPIKAEFDALLKYRHVIQQVITDDIQAALDKDTDQRVFETNEEYYSGWLGFNEIKARLYEINPHFKIQIDMESRVWGVLYTTLL